MGKATNFPLSGLRVVDLSVEIAGPYCAKMLVDAGADVIKVEQPAGDPLRRWTGSGDPPPDGGDGALFQHLNAGKRGVCAALDEPAGRDVVLDLARTAGLVVESFAPGTLDEWGLGLGCLQERNPSLSLVSITPWGGTGPWARRPATELTLQAATGSTAHRGLPDRVPVSAGGRIGEWIAGCFAAAGALLAWLSARRTGRGHHVDLSMFETMLLSMTYFHDLTSQWRDGVLHRGVEVPSIEPAKDGWVGFCTITGQQWKDFCLLIEQPELGDDEAYLDGMKRSADVVELRRIIHTWTGERTVDEIVELAGRLRIPVAPIGDGRSLPDMDHFVEREVFVDGPGGFLRPRPPYRLEKAALRPAAPAPGLGQHTQEVCAETCNGAAGGAGGDGEALPLAGLRVVDLATFWAGPVVGCVLADMGADVVKVESIQRPDGMRFAGAMQKEALWEWSPVFAGVNTGKRGITLRLDDDEGRDLIKELIRGADVVIENFSPRVVENFGLGWDVVREINPRTIMVRMPAFGLGGPWRDRAGFAMTVEQASGLAWVTGYDDMPLVVRGACDPVGGMHAVFALLVALEHRRKTGEGQLVEVALVESALNIAAEQVIEYSAYGNLLCRNGNRGPATAPQGVYRCAGDDAYVAIAVATDEQWMSLDRLIGPVGSSHNPRPATAAARRAAHDEIDARIEAWSAGREADAAAETLVAAGVPASPLINGYRLMPNPQLAHRGFFQVLRHPVTGETRYPGLPMSFSGLPRALHRCPPPTLGQHNGDVLGGELGLTEEGLRELRERGVIGEQPSFM